MPQIQRVMKRCPSDPAAPRAGGAEGLGARDPQDVEPDAARDVHPGRGGMSVLESPAAMLRRLEPSFLPRAWRAALLRIADSEDARVKARGAEGRGLLWRHGSGSWAPVAISDELVLRIDPDDPGHGFVEPSRTMGLDAYRAGISQTRRAWTVVQAPDERATA